VSKTFKHRLNEMGGRSRIKRLQALGLNNNNNNNTFVERHSAV